MATIAGIVTAAAGAYAANRQASAANKPRTGYTDQTTTQNPYHAELIEPDLNDVLWRQRMLADQGIPQVDANGNLYYAHRDQLGTYAPTPTTPANAPGPANAAARRAGKAPAAPAGMRVNKAGKTVPVRNPAAGSGGTGSAATPTAPSYNTPEAIFSEAARRGFATGDTATVGQGRAAIGNVLGGTGTAAGATTSGTGFGGYNPILDRQAQRLEADADSRVGRDLLLDFLDENDRGGGGGNPSYGGNGNGSGGRTGGANVQYGYQAGTGGAPAPMQYGGPGGPGGPNGGVPDTMVPDSYFGTETRRLMDEQANDAELQTLIDAMNADVERSMFRDQAQLDAAAAGAGRFGGDMWKGMSRDAREEALQEMLKTSSSVRVGDRESRRQARLAALAGVNQRDLGLLGANVQREGIAANERAAGAAAGAGAAAMQDQLALARRGQDLDALSQLLDYEQFGLGQISGIGGQLSSDQLAAMGMIPGLEGVGLAGLDVATRSGGGMVDLAGQRLQAGAARQAANLQQQGLNLQRAQFNAGMGQGQLNDYLATLRNIGSLGGSSRTVGSNVQPGLGVNPTAAAIQGGIGGGLAGYGAVAGYR